MSEKNLDFDKVWDRKNTNSLKYDFAKKRGMPECVQPLWVADMDFKTSSYIQDALFDQVEHGIFGYSDSLDDYTEVLNGWMEKHYNWKIQPEWLIKTPGIVFALALLVKAYTNLGDGVLIQQPVYYPFSEVILDNGRRVVDNTLILHEDGKYRIDFKDFEEKIIKEKIKLFFLCNPHNPVGRVWTREELETLGDICVKHHVIVVSDEIHADFAYGGVHQVFSNLKKEYEAISVTCTSPSKTFNLAGLQISNIFIQDKELRRRFQKQVDAAGYSQVNAMGLTACGAAYEYGEEWYEGMLSYVVDNIRFLQEWVRDHIPSIHVIEPEGTYLVWIDFRGLGLTTEELEELIVEKAGLWLDSGAVFGESGKGFQRINAACPRRLLLEALVKLKDAVDSL